MAANQVVGVYISQFVVVCNSFQCFALPQRQPKLAHSQQQ
jgi:hypothetical protein